MDEAISPLAKEIAAKTFVDEYQKHHQLGPDYILPSKEFLTWERNGAVYIFREDDDDELLRPQSVVSFFHRTVVKYPRNIALMVKRNDVVHTWSYLEYWHDVQTVAKGFIKLGLRPLHGLCILGCNSPEWIISYLGTIFAGGFCAGIYVTNSADATFHVLNDCKANVAVVENELQLEKILQFKDKLPNLQAIIQYAGKISHPGVLSWSDLLYIGKSASEDVLELRLKGIALNQCCSLIYTSGTTGNAKGVMLSHDNIVTATKLLCKDYLLHKDGCERFISYLPLSHVAAISHDVYVPIYVGGNVYFAPPDALKSNILLDSFHDVLPTSFVGVPRIYEKIYEKMQEIETQITAPTKNLLKWSQGQATKFHSSNGKKIWNRCMFSVAKKLMLNRTKSTLGLQFTEFLLCGSAPLSADVHKYFFGLDLPIVEGYAQSESSGLHVVARLGQCKIGSVGKPDEFNNFEVKIESSQDGAGEIFLRGRNIFMGYINLKEKTEEAIDNERWLQTGDIGKIDEDGYLFITGRIKELIITSGGENIPPVIIERVIKKLVPAISNCMLIGDRRKYLTMLITISTELDPVTSQPSDRLSKSAIAWFRSCGSDVSSVSEILQTRDTAFSDAIQRAIDTYNDKHAISHAQRIQKWRILARDFSVQGGELGPTAKLKRSFVVEKYSEIIEQMYGES